MRYLEELREVLTSLFAQRVRAFLTLLGIILGVGTLVFLSSLVEGSAAFMKYRVQTAAGSDLISVTPGWDPRTWEKREIDRFDVRALAGALKQDGAIVLARYIAKVPIGDRWTERVYAVGCAPESRQMYGLEVAQGRFVVQSDVWSHAPVAVLGSKAVKDLLPGVDQPIGAEVKLKGHRFVVVGVLAPKPSQNKGNAWKWDTSVILAEPVFRARFATGEAVEEVIVKVPDALVAAGDTGRLSQRVEAVMAGRHPGEHRFEITDASRESGEDKFIVPIVIGLEVSIAAVCLVVGGINIMNILMVTVVQRRREIGIRRSMGATKGSIQRQFLVEACVLAAIGGLLGIVAGNLGAWLIAQLFTAMWGHWPFVAAPLQMGLGFGAAVLTGLVFGWWPAKRAAELKPIECLRAD